MFSSLDLHFLLLTFYEDHYVFAFRSSERMWKAVCLFVVVLLLYGFMGNKNGTFMSKPEFLLLLLCPRRSSPGHGGAGVPRGSCMG